MRINVAGILAVAAPASDGRPPIQLAWREAAVRTFVPVEIIGGHHATHRPAQAIGVVDWLGVQNEGWDFRGWLDHPGSIRTLRRYGELPLSAEYRVYPGEPPCPLSEIEWPLPTTPTGIVLAVAVLQPWETGAYRGSSLWEER